jgi:hypothetical protein
VLAVELFLGGVKERIVDDARHWVRNPVHLRPLCLSAGIKRLRRENEVLRQERDILKKATAFFAKEGSR